MDSLNPFVADKPSASVGTSSYIATIISVLSGEVHLGVEVSSYTEIYLFTRKFFFKIRSSPDVVARPREYTLHVSI